MRVAIDAVGIRDFGGAVLLDQLIGWLPRARPDWEWKLYLLPHRERRFEDPAPNQQVSVESIAYGGSALTRLYWIYRDFPQRAARWGADVVLAFANIGVGRPDIAQVIYCHQPLAILPESAGTQSFPDMLRMRVLRSLVCRGMRSSRAVVVQTRAMKHRLAELVSGVEQRIHVIPGGCRAGSRTPHIRPQKRDLIDNLEQPWLLYVAQPVPHKNHLMLLHALPLIVQWFPEIRLVLTVDPPETAGRRQPAGYAGQIHHVVRVLGLRDSVVFAGTLTPDEVHYALSLASMLVFPSLAESFGLPLAEAMGAGCPVAASDLSYAREIVGEAGAYFNPEDPSAIAFTVTALLDQPGRLRQLSELAAGRKHRFEYPRIAERLARVLEQAAGAGAHRPGPRPGEQERVISCVESQASLER